VGRLSAGAISEACGAIRGRVNSNKNVANDDGLFALQGCCIFVLDRLRYAQSMRRLPLEVTALFCVLNEGGYVDGIRTIV
jgi:hypothetical protein